MVYIRSNITLLLKLLSAINKLGIEYSASILNILKYLIK